ncbi:alpha-1,2-fucosyltransferase, partial [Planktothrix sp.]
DVVGAEQTFEVAEQVILNATEPLKNVNFRGYFQLHTQYYAKDKNFFCSLFKPIADVSAKMEKVMNQLRSAGKTIVGIHLRRGDYNWAGNQNPYLRIAPNEWYLDWLKGFWETLDHPVLFIASDEIEEVVKDFSDYQPVTTQDLGVEISEAPFYPDFYILSQCDVLAISNSTFSFAASMLNERCKFFFRPHLYAEKLIPYDPWNSEPLLRYTSSQAPISQSLTQAIVEEVVQLLPWNPEILYGFNLDYPQVGQAIYREIFVSGWVLGKKSPVTHVELIVEGQSIEIIEVQGKRPDVAHILSGIPGAESSGFSK